MRLHLFGRQDRCHLTTKSTNHTALASFQAVICFLGTVLEFRDQSLSCNDSKKRFLFLVRLSKQLRFPSLLMTAPRLLWQRKSLCEQVTFTVDILPPGSFPHGRRGNITPARAGNCICFQDWSFYHWKISSRTFLRPFAYLVCPAATNLGLWSLQFKI